MTPLFILTHTEGKENLFALTARSQISDKAFGGFTKKMDMPLLQTDVQHE
jgi:hypothetical protein